MKRVILIVVMLFLLTVGFVSAEQGDLELGWSRGIYTGPLGIFYAELFITDNIEFSLYFGYLIKGDIGTYSDSDKYLYGASIGYDITSYDELPKSKGKDFIFGIDVGHSNFVRPKVIFHDPAGYGSTGWNISAFTKYSQSFKFGLTLGISAESGVLFDTYNSALFLSEEGGIISSQCYFTVDIYIGWKFEIENKD